VINVKPGYSIYIINIQVEKVVTWSVSMLSDLLGPTCWFPIGLNSICITMASMLLHEKPASCNVLWLVELKIMSVKYLVMLSTFCLFVLHKNPHVLQHVKLKIMSVKYLVVIYVIDILSLHVGLVLQHTSVNRVENNVGKYLGVIHVIDILPICYSINPPRPTSS
jgi:hypothetical protein